MIVNSENLNSVTCVNKYPIPCSQSVMSSAEKLIPCLGHMLTKLTQEAPLGGNKDSKFYCKTKPAISVSEYLKSIYLLHVRNLSFCQLFSICIFEGSNIYGSISKHETRFHFELA